MSAHLVPPGAVLRTPPPAAPQRHFLYTCTSCEREYDSERHKITSGEFRYSYNWRLRTHRERTNDGYVWDVQYTCWVAFSTVIVSGFECAFMHRGGCRGRHVLETQLELT
jgi:hypothetical protein